MARDTLRLLTCGSVDDGKSTLIGRLLHDAQGLREDEMAALAANTSRFGTVAEGLDFALLLDGLQAEREQGITIDVAYRHMTTAKRAFIIADTPGHAQYTRNMATGASTADAAILLVDARKGILPQTRRHALINALMGIRHVILAVNKMDAVDWDRACFEAITAEWAELSVKLGLTDTLCLPLSALTGDNLSRPSSHMPWYQGRTLLEHLETVEIKPAHADGGFRLPVQLVLRPNQDFRGYAGTVADGMLKPGTPVVALPSGRTSTVARIVTQGSDLDQAEPGQAVTVTLADELDITRGDLLAAAIDRPEIADQFTAHVVWMAEQPLFPGRHYLLRLGTATVGCSVTEIKHVVEPETLGHIAAKSVELNGIALCNLELARPIPFESYARSRTMGGFILMDRLTNATLACGMVEHGLRRAHNIHVQALDVGKKDRARIKSQTACALWFTGLSGSGKSTIANALERRLLGLGRHTMLLDGDNLRHGLNRDLGFTEADRVENIRRAAEAARLMVEAGLMVLTAFISPYRTDRADARALFDPGEFVEIFVDAPLEICEARDPKGLYRKARNGEIPNFTGIGAPYEAPEDPEITVDGGGASVEEAVDSILARLAALGII